MIRALRKRHLAIWLTLALLLPLLLLAALRARDERLRARTGEIPSAVEPYAKAADDASRSAR